jgi:AcrR family transcriptional regulator
MATGEDTRSRILDAAIEMMESSGEASIRVATIAAKLDIAEPSIYHHFTNRAALVEEAYAEWYWRCLEIQVPMATVMALVDNREEYLSAIFKSVTWSYQKDRHAARAVRITVLGAAQRNPQLAKTINDINRQFLASVADSMKEAQKRKWVRSDLDPIATAYWFHGQILGRVVAEMDEGIVDLEHWDALSYEVISTILRP